jgi:hypothetical protein
MYRKGVTMSVKWKWISILSSVALTVAVAGAWLLGTTMTASASEMTAEDLQTLTQSTTEPGLLGEGYLAHGGWGRRGFGDGPIDYQQLLADALGITVEQLEEAYEAARAAALEQAVEQGLITEEQAEKFSGKMLGGRFGDLLGRGYKGRGPQGLTDDATDGNALLADALGISTEDLQAAREQASQAALEQAISEGTITQEQADEMAERKQTHEAVASYLDQKALMAAALGLSVDELEAALAEGKTMRDLFEESELDAATVRENMQAAREAALAQAVADGVITQEQADELSDQGARMGGFGGRGKKLDPENMPDRESMPDCENMPDREGLEGFRGRGGFGGRRPGSPDSDGTDDDSTSGTRFRRPGPINQDSSAL